MASENLGAKRRKINSPQDPSLHTIASYNMSFASDLGTTKFGSEKHFVHDANKRIKNRKAKGSILPDPDDQDPNTHPLRHAWKRAAKLVRLFWEAEKPSAMGLQEMNTKEKVGEASPAEGYEKLQRILGDMEYLRFYANSVINKNGSFPTLLTIWDKDKLGEIMTKKEGNDLISYEYVADIGLDDPFKHDPNHQGRPITIISTTKGFVLINLHSPNVSEQSYELNMIALRVSINMHLKKFLEQYRVPLDTNKLFIMGDFNDPFHAIKSSTPLLISQAGIDTPLFYSTNDDEIKSCCYNFDSACPDGDRNKTPNRQHEMRESARGKLSADPYECYIREDHDKDIDERLDGNVKTNAVVDDEDADEIGLQLSMGARGLLTNYQYTGDYVMGANVVTNLQIYRPEGTEFFTKYSLESDHEMVFATFASPVAGGRMRRTRHKVRRTSHKQNAHHKQRRTRNKARRTRRN